MFYEVILGRKIGRLDGTLTYSFAGKLATGTLVEVPVGQSRAPGVVVAKVMQPAFKCREITRILYKKPLPEHLLMAIKWLAAYYQAPASSMLGMVLPVGILKNRRKTSSLPQPAAPAKTEQDFANTVVPLNSAQKRALLALEEAPEATKLLLGVTGSGKTNIYLELTKNALKRQKSVVLLVPEIALTGQLVRVFGEVFGERVVLIHSQQTEAERHKIFENILEETTPRIIVGPRSALFAPLHNLELIIIDEAHESTYYQDNTPRYSAVRAASFMARHLKGACILGSATPTVADYYLAKEHKSLVILNQKAKKEAKKPTIQVIDFKKRENFSQNRYFSNILLAAIRRNLAAKQQTLIFHNRRGSSPLTLCENCGEELLCPSCFLPLILHVDNYNLVCHTCGYTCQVPAGCPKCGAADLVHKGFGTKLLETELVRLFPAAKVMRFDADNKKEEGLAAVYEAVRDGAVDILVGTQTLAKGLDLPRLATVGVAQADAGLNLPDYAAEERSFQLLTQVIGRVGRGHCDKAEVIVQTFRPDHPVLQFALAEDYLGFSQYLLDRRRQGGFPPFSFVMRLEITMKTEATVLKKVRLLAAQLALNPQLMVSPPLPAFHEHTSRGYTWQVIVRAKTRRALTDTCAKIDPNFRVILDPPSLL